MSTNTEGPARRRSWASLIPLRRRPSHGTPSIDWRTIPADELSHHPDLLDQLLSRTVDGVTITGVLTESEAHNAVSLLQREEWTEIFFGGVIGISLGMVTPDEPDRSRYFDDTLRSRVVAERAFGFDPHKRLQAVLEPIASGRSLVPPTEGGRPYNPGQLRLWRPGHGGLRAHVGNEFRRDLEQDAMRHLVTVTSVSDHLSYFIVLQPPDVGGSLSVYDLCWEDDDARKYGWMGDRDDSDFDELPCLRVSPAAGDLVLFGGGWRWHRVDPLTGQRARLTYGGFCAPSIDDDAVHFWS